MLQAARYIVDEMDELTHDVNCNYYVKHYEIIPPGYDYIVKLRGYNKDEDRWEDVEIHYGHGSPGYDDMRETYVFRTWQVD